MLEEYKGEIEVQKGKIVEYEKQIESLTKENQELVQFKSNIEETERKSEIDGICSKFSQLEEKELETLKEKAYSKEISSAQLETELYALYGKLNFTKKSSEEKAEKVVEDGATYKTNFSASQSKVEDTRFSAIKHLFEK